MAVLVKNLVCPSYSTPELPSGQSKPYSTRGPKAKELQARLSQLIKRFPSLEQAIPSGVIFKYENLDEGLAGVADENTIIIGSKFLEIEHWNSQLDISESPDITKHHYVSIGRPDQLPSEYHILAEIYQEHSSAGLELPIFQNLLHRLPKTERIKALRAAIRLAQYKKYQRIGDLNAGAILIHELEHIHQHRRATGLCQYKKTALGNISRTSQFVVGSYPAYWSQSIEQPAYIAGDRFLQINGAAMDERRELLRGFFVDIYRSEDIRKHINHAYNNSSLDFKQLLNELWPDYLEN